MDAKEAAAIAESGTSAKLEAAEAIIDALMPSVFEEIEAVAVTGGRTLIYKVNKLDEFSQTVLRRRLENLGYAVATYIHNRLHILW